MPRSQSLKKAQDKLDAKRAEWRVVVRLTEGEAAAADGLRGNETRAALLRRLLAEEDGRKLAGQRSNTPSPEPKRKK